MEYLEAKELIIRGKVGEALRLLRAPLQGTSLYDEWMVLSSRYGQLEEQEMKGLLSPQDLSIERNRITEAVVRLLDRARADASVPLEGATRPQAQGTSRSLRLLGAALGVAALLILAYLIWPASSPPAESAQPTTSETSAADASAAETEPAPANQQAEPAPSRRQQPPAVAETSGDRPRDAAFSPASESAAEPPNRPAPNETSAGPSTVAPRPAPIPDESANDRYDRYVIRKRVNNDYLPFEMHYMGVGERHVYLELTVSNPGGKDVEIKEVHLRHSGDNSSASSYNLKEHIVPAGQKEKLTAKFRWQLGQPAAFRLKLIYRLAGERSWREVRNDFGVYHRAD